MDVFEEIQKHFNTNICGHDDRPCEGCKKLAERAYFIGFMDAQQGSSVEQLKQYNFIRQIALRSSFCTSSVMARKFLAENE